MVGCQRCGDPEEDIHVGASTAGSSLGIEEVSCEDGDGGRCGAECERAEGQGPYGAFGPAPQPAEGDWQAYQSGSKSKDDCENTNHCGICRIHKAGFLTRNSDSVGCPGQAPTYKGQQACPSQAAGETELV